MFTKKSIGAALVCALALGASGAAFASPINVGGVVWDPDSPLDMNVQALNFRETTVHDKGDKLIGYGKIGSINGTDPDVFCPGCDLNFTFTYTVKSTNPVPGGNDKIVFDMGTINFYVDDTESFNVTDPSTAGIGSLWLTLKGHNFTSSDPLYLTDGELFATVVGTIASPGDGSNGFGLLDATGGPAWAYVNTNSKQDGSDFTLNSDFLFQDAGICDTSGTCYPISGTGNLIGNSMIPVVVPEPAELGLLGLGLGALGFFIWRRRKEEGEDRG
jgi:hypothetical protein